MPYSRDAHISRARVLAAAALLCATLMAGCGGSSPHATAATAGRATSSGSSTATGTVTKSSRSGASDASPSGLSFARCMRANGVPNFPDPLPGRGFVFTPGGIDPTAPAVKAAQAKCQKFVPSGFPPFGSTTHPSSQTLAKLRNIAVCMRAHGVPDFPDPRTSIPSNPLGSGTGVITDYDGAILLFPATLNIHSPAYTQAAAACGTLAQKLGNGPHG